MNDSAMSISRTLMLLPICRSQIMQVEAGFRSSSRLRSFLISASSRGLPASSVRDRLPCECCDLSGDLERLPKTEFYIYAS